MKQRMRRTALCLAAALCVGMGGGARAAEELPFSIEAKAAILVDAATGQVIWEKNADEQLDPAGMAKLMSALLVSEALESGTLDPEGGLSVSAAAAATGGMSAFLTRGESYGVQELFRAMMMISANDATVVLAEALCGSQEGFAAAMQERAAQFSLDAKFVNPTGHKAQGQTMSARDGAKLACELAKHPAALEYASVYSGVLIHPGGRTTELVNPNRLVRFYSGCDGLSTGSNNAALYCGAFTAKRGTDRFVAVIFGAPNADARAQGAQKLLDYAFANYQSVIVIEEGKGVAKDVPVAGGRKRSVHGVAGEGVSLLLKKGEAGQIEKEPVIFEELSAPVEKGQTIGELTVKKDGEVVARVPIVAYERVEKASVSALLRVELLDWLRR